MTVISGGAIPQAVLYFEPHLCVFSVNDFHADSLQFVQMLILKSYHNVYSFRGQKNDLQQT